MKIYNQIIGMVVLFLGCTLYGMEPQPDANQMQADAESKLEILAHYYLAQEKTWVPSDFQGVHSDLKKTMESLEKSSKVLAFRPSVNDAVEKFYACIDVLLRARPQGIGITLGDIEKTKGRLGKRSATSSKIKSEAGTADKSQTKEAVSSDPKEATTEDIVTGFLGRRINEPNGDFGHTTDADWDEYVGNVYKTPPASPNTQKKKDEEAAKRKEEAKNKPSQSSESGGGVAKKPDRKGGLGSIRGSVDTVAQATKELIGFTVEEFEANLEGWHSNLKEKKKGEYCRALFTSLWLAHGEVEAEHKLTVLARYYLSKISVWEQDDFTEIYADLKKTAQLLDGKYSRDTQRLCFILPDAGLSIAQLYQALDELYHPALRCLKCSVEECKAKVDAWHAHEAERSMLCKTLFSSMWLQARLFSLCAEVKAMQDNPSAGAEKLSGQSGPNNVKSQPDQSAQDAKKGSTEQEAANPQPDPAAGAVPPPPPPSTSFADWQKAQGSYATDKQQGNGAGTKVEAEKPAGKNPSQAQSGPAYSVGDITGVKLKKTNPGSGQAKSPEKKEADGPPLGQHKLKKTGSRFMPIPPQDPPVKDSATPAPKAAKAGPKAKGGSFKGKSAPKASSDTSGAAGGHEPVKVPAKYNPGGSGPNVSAHDPAKTGPVPSKTGVGPRKAPQGPNAGAKTNGTAKASPKKIGQSGPATHTGGTPGASQGTHGGAQFGGTPGTGGAPQQQPSGQHQGSQSKGSNTGSQSNSQGPNLGATNPPGGQGGPSNQVPVLKPKEQLSLGTVLAVTAVVGLSVWAFKTYYWDPRHKSPNDIAFAV